MEMFFRVLAVFFGYRTPIFAKAKGEKKIEILSQSTYPKKKPATFHQANDELWSKICVPKT